MALADFLGSVADLETLVGADQLGPTELYQPERYAVQSVVVDDPSVFAGDSIEPMIVDWPGDASVQLTALVGEPGAWTCMPLPAVEFGDLFASANQLTLFVDGDTTYQVYVRPMLPGDTCGA